ADVITMVPNPNYFSNILHPSVLSKIIFKSSGTKDTLIQGFKSGDYDKAEDFLDADRPKFADLPSNQVIITPSFTYQHLEFNQRDVAPSAKDNGGKAPFADPMARKAFIESFNRNAAIQGILGLDPNDKSVKTNEFTSPIDPSYDANAPYPAFSITQAAK